MIFHDDFESDISRSINRDKKMERERFVNKTIASYFKNEYKLDVNVKRIVSTNKDDIDDKGMLTLSIDAIGRDIQVPYRIEEGDIIIESDAFENRLGLRKFRVNVDGRIFDTKALNVKYASEKLANNILEEYPVVSIEGKKYDEKNKVLLSKEIENNIVESFEKREESNDFEDEIPSIVVEKSGEESSLDHILPNISVNSGFSEKVEKERQYQKLINLTSSKISEILSDINENLEVDNVHIDAIERDAENEDKGVVTGTTRILDKDFSVSLRYTASVDGDEVKVDGLFDLIKGYYNIKGYKVPLGDKTYEVEADSKKQAVIKILNHLMADGEEYTYDGRKLIPSNVDFIATIIVNENESAIEEVKSYDQSMSGSSDKRWEVSEDGGDIYLRKLLDAKKS